MYTGNVWGIALFLAGFLAALIGFQLLLGAVLPRRTDEALATLRSRSVGSAFLGMAVVGGMLVAAAVFGKFGGPGKFLAAVTLALGAFPMVTGLGVVSRFVGERMPSPVDAASPWRATMRGGVTCALAFAIPFVGWFLVLPGSVVMGTGALVLSLLSPRRAEVAAPAVQA